MTDKMTINLRRWETLQCWQVTTYPTGDNPRPARSTRGCPRRAEFTEEGRRKSTHFSHLPAPYPLRVNSPPSKLHLPLITSDTEQPSREQRHHLEKWGRESDPRTLGRLPGCQHKGSISELKFQHPPLLKDSKGLEEGGRGAKSMTPRINPYPEQQAPLLLLWPLLLPTLTRVPNPMWHTMSPESCRGPEVRLGHSKAILPSNYVGVFSKKKKILRQGLT